MVVTYFFCMFLIPPSIVSWAFFPAEEIPLEIWRERKRKVRGWREERGEGEKMRGEGEKMRGGGEEREERREGRRKRRKHYQSGLELILRKKKKKNCLILAHILPLFLFFEQVAQALVLESVQVLVWCRMIWSKYLCMTRIFQNKKKEKRICKRWG